MRLPLTALVATAGAIAVAPVGAIGDPLGGPLAAQEGPAPRGGPTPFEVVRVERMLDRRLACLGCHVIGGRGGRIGPSLDGLGDRAAAEYVREVIRDPAAVLPGTRMPRQRMRAREIERLAAYLTTRPDPTPTAERPAPPEAPPVLGVSEREDGAALYARHCAACHGPTGGGDGWNAPDLPVQPTAHSDAAAMSARSDDSLFDAIHSGAFVLDGSPRMPPYGDLLSSAQIRALVSHIRSLCDCAQPAWAGGR